jgi:uncharacterized protein
VESATGLACSQHVTSRGDGRTFNRLKRRSETKKATILATWRLSCLALQGSSTVAGVRGLLALGRSRPKLEGKKEPVGQVDTEERRMAEKDNKGSMTVAEAGRKGGETVRNERGRGFYEAIGRKGGATVKAERGRSFYEEIGRKGGETVKAERGAKFYEEIGKKGGDRVKATRGPTFYEEIGRKGGQKVKKLIEEGKRAARAAAPKEEPEAAAPAAVEPAAVEPSAPPVPEEESKAE